ncbi:MAG: hypothetical protein ACI8UP_002776 [Porticoccaceae bacterium]|jgi:hypothetical protein
MSKTSAESFDLLTGWPRLHSGYDDCRTRLGSERYFDDI